MKTFYWEYLLKKELWKWFIPVPISKIIFKYDQKSHTTNFYVDMALAHLPSPSNMDVQLLLTRHGQGAGGRWLHYLPNNQQKPGKNLSSVIIVMITIAMVLNQGQLAFLVTFGNV